MSGKSYSIVGVIYLMTAAAFTTYFIYSTIQGNYGILQKMQLIAETRELTLERDRLQNELTQVQALSKRLSDHYLDLDLLDQQLRETLGYIRADEMSIR